MEFGVVNPESEWDAKWPYQMRFSKPDAPRFNIQGSPAMHCDKVMDEFDGKLVTEIIDEFATDNEKWAIEFLSGWHQMTTNGYAKEDLADGPENGWLGYYSLTQQSGNENLFEKMSFADYISENAPVTFTDPAVNIYSIGNTRCYPGGVWGYSDKFSGNPEIIFFFITKTFYEMF